MTGSLSREKNNELYSRVMAGDEQARQQMIEGNMALVGNKVNAFIRGHPQAGHLRDDLRSAGYIGLVQAVNAMDKHENPENPNPTGYLSIAIHREIKRLADGEALISVPDRTQRDARKENRQIKAPTVHQGIPKSFDDQKQDSPLEVIELRDLLDSCCESDDERTILRMREEGYSDRNIADAIGLSHTTTYMMRRELEKRFQNKLQELEE